MMAERLARISVNEAFSLIESAVSPVHSETVQVAQAFSRIAASPVHAVTDTPRFRASAMDGYAVASRDIAVATPMQPVSLSVGAIVAAGTWPPPLQPGLSVPIATGAPVPEGADAVIAREATTVIAGRLVIQAPIEAGRNVRQIGEDCSAGSLVLAPGMRLGPDAIGALAAFGVERVQVWRTPRIGLITTGDEISGPGPLAAAALIDSNSPMIAACAASAGLEFGLLGRAPDRAEAIDQLLEAADDPRSGDIILSTGGVSVGDFDLVRLRLEGRGCRILFHGVGMRPGKPLLFALLPDGRPFFGLPGTPLAALIGFRFFVGIAIRRMLGLPPEVREFIQSDEPGRSDTTVFLRGRRSLDAQGRVVVDTNVDQRPHILSSMLGCDCWLRVDRMSPGLPKISIHSKELPWA